MILLVLALKEILKEISDDEALKSIESIYRQQSSPRTDATEGGTQRR